ncbi:MAG: hypothetical protein WC343_05545 [Bacilli bacterium]
MDPWDRPIRTRHPVSLSWRRSWSGGTATPCARRSRAWNGASPTRIATVRRNAS